MYVHRTSSADDHTDTEGVDQEEEEDMTDEKAINSKQGFSYLSSILTESLSLSLNSAIETILSCQLYLNMNDLNFSRCYLLALVQSLSSNDLLLTTALIKNLNKFTSISSLHMKVWFVEEVSIKKDKIKDALDYIYVLNSSKLLTVPQNVIDFLQVLFDIIDRKSINTLTEEINQISEGYSRRESECSWELCDEEEEEKREGAEQNDDRKLYERLIENNVSPFSAKTVDESNYKQNSDGQLAKRDNKDVSEKKQSAIYQYINRVGFLSQCDENSELLPADQYKKQLMKIEGKDDRINENSQNKIETNRNIPSEQFSRSVRDGNREESMSLEERTNDKEQERKVNNPSFLEGVGALGAEHNTSNPQRTSAVYIPPKICPIAMPTNYTPRHRIQDSAMTVLDTKASSSTSGPNSLKAKKESGGAECSGWWRKGMLADTAAREQARTAIEPANAAIEQASTAIEQANAAREQASTAREQANAQSCHFCGQLFSQLHSKHSCIYCGEMFCDQCSVKFSLCEGSNSELQKACRACFERYIQSRKDHSNSSVLWERGSSSFSPKRKVKEASKKNNGFIPQNIASSNELSTREKEITLREAVMKGDISAVKRCLAKGVDINSKDPAGFTPFHLSVELNNNELCDILLEYDILIETRADCGLTPLHSAVSNNNEEMLNKLIICGASVLTEDTDGNSPLHTAVGRGNPTIIEKLLRDSDINKVNSAGMSALHVAVSNEHGAIVEMLLENGANPNAKNNIGWTPLHFAVAKSNESIVKCLLNNFAESDIKNDIGLTPFHQAVSQGDVPMAKYFMERGAKLCTEDNKGQQPIHTAAERNHPDTLEMLISADVDINSKTKDGKTSLHIAAAHGFLDLAETLVNFGAVVGVRDNCGRNPFYFAALSGNMRMVKYLLDRGTDVQEKDDEGRGLLHWAAWNGDEKVIKLLLNLGCPISVKTISGNTPLHFAAFRGHENIVKLLIEYRANINETNERNLTARGMALLNKKTDIAKLLQTIEENSLFKITFD